MTFRLTAEDAELFSVLSKLHQGADMKTVVRLALRSHYRALMLLPWQRGAPRSFSAARQVRAAALAAEREARGEAPEVGS